MNKTGFNDLLSNNIINSHTIKISLADSIVIAIIIIMSILFIQLAIHKHNVYQSYAWDLGIFGQILRSTLEGKFMYHTAQLYLVPSGNHLLIHFTPGLLLLLPIYALFPYATTLLIIKPIVTFAAAYPLYLLTKRVANNNIVSIMVVLLFCAYPLLHGALYFDFQPAIFLPLFIFLVEYAYITNKKILYLLSLSLLSLTAEHGALASVILITIQILYKYIINKIDKFKILKGYMLNYDTNNFGGRLIFITFISTLIYLISVTLFLEYAQEKLTVEETRYILKAYQNFSILGYKGNSFLIPFYAITHISDTFNALKYDYVAKIIFIMLVFGTLLFLPLQSIYGFIAIILITPLILSNYASYYLIGLHYPYYYLGFVFLGLVAFIHRITNNIDKIRILISTLLISSLLLISFAPWSELSSIFMDKGLASFPKLPNAPGHTMLALNKLVDIANREDLPLLVQNNVFTHTTQKSHVYVSVPYDLYQRDRSYFEKYINDLIDKVDLILLNLNEPLADNVYTSAIKKGFGVYAEGYNSVLLKRNYTSEPILNENRGRCVNMFFHKDVYKNDGIVGLAKKKGIVVYGPYRSLLQGSYLITYEVRAKNIDTLAAIAVVEVTSDVGTVEHAKRIVSGYELADGNLHNITLLFNVREPFKTGLEFRVRSLGNADIEFKDCYIERIGNNARGSGEVGVLANELLFNTGFKSNYTVTLPKGIKTDTFWYGPKIKMVSGVYLAEIYLKIEPMPSNKVIDISIVYDDKRYDVSIDDDSLIALGNNWYIAMVPFVLEKNVNNFEIVGRNPNSNYEITISHINIRVI